MSMGRRAGAGLVLAAAVVAGACGAAGRSTARPAPAGAVATGCQRARPSGLTCVGLPARDHGARVADLDFAGTPDAASRQINAWVSEATRKLIPELFPAASIDPSPRLVLADTVYLKADRLHRFD